VFRVADEEFWPLPTDCKRNARVVKLVPRSAQSLPRKACTPFFFARSRVLELYPPRSRRFKEKKRKKSRSLACGGPVGFVR